VNMGGHSRVAAHHRWMTIGAAFRYNKCTRIASRSGYY